MKEYLINIDLFCFRSDNNPKNYRLYVDGDLITERTYIWINAGHDSKHGKYVKENIWVNLEPGEHEVTVVAIDKSPGKFYFRNLLIDQIPVEHNNGKFIIN